MRFQRVHSFVALVQVMLRDGGSLDAAFELIKGSVLTLMSRPSRMSPSSPRTPTELPEQLAMMCRVLRVEDLSGDTARD